MFTKAKDKTKQATLRIKAKVTPNRATVMAGAQTVSLADIPMANGHGVVAQPIEKLPGLYAMGQATKPTKKTTAKKSLRFEETKEVPDPLMPMAPLMTDEEASKDEEIIECDTATQTVLRTELETATSEEVSTSEVTSTDQTESQEEGASSYVGSSTGRARPPKKSRKF